MTTCGFAVVAIDAPGHGDRPRTTADDEARADLRDTFATGGPMMEIVSRYGTSLAERAVLQ